MEDDPQRGWYEDPWDSSMHRRWDGVAWTGWTGPADSRSASDRINKRWTRVLALSLFVPLLISPMAIFVLIGGDPFPISRSGVTKIGGDIIVLNALCDGENIQSVTLSSIGATRDDPSEVVWAVEGSAAAAEIPVGASVPGLDVEVRSPRAWMGSTCHCESAPRS